MLSEAMAPYFGGRVRARGHGYYRTGRVELQSFEDGAIDAIVYGQAPYRVELDLVPRGVFCEAEAYCRCPHGRNTRACKHIWALIRLLDHEYRAELELLLDGARAVQLLGARWRKDGPPAPPAPPKPPPGPAWVEALNDMPRASDRSLGVSPWELPLTLWYVIDERETAQSGLKVQVTTRTTRLDGQLSKPRLQRIEQDMMQRLPDPADRAIALMLLGTRERQAFWSGSQGWQLPDGSVADLLERMAGTGRLLLRKRDPDELRPLAWDPAPFVFEVAVSDAGDDAYEFRAVLRHGSERHEVDAFTHLFTPEDILVHGDVLHPIDNRGCGTWLRRLRRRGPLRIATSEATALLERLGDLAEIPRIAWPEAWEIDDRDDEAPRCTLSLATPDSATRASTAALMFEYREASVPATSERPVFVDPDQRSIVRRNEAAEADALERLLSLGVRRDHGNQWLIPAGRLVEVLAPLLAEGWQVHGERGRIQAADKFEVQVSSGIDWFDIRGRAEFDGRALELPALLAAARKGTRMIELGDGSTGILPQSWLERHEHWLQLGQVDGDAIRFSRTQAGLIDALLGDVPDAAIDDGVARARQELARFSQVRAAAAPRGFRGDLRPYQREGLGWLRFLDRFGWGGCLADDMGLGKTVQCLALLAGQRRTADLGPSLLVLPKTLVFNWAREAERFAPKLRVLDYTGPQRRRVRGQIAEADLVLTTYGTVRRDIASLRDIAFNYVILDEAQAVKNPRAQASKAVRVLNARRRLALTGTPVENAVSDLWSIFEFLNPGMLGSLRAFEGISRSAGPGKPAGITPELQRMLRPFILRRTKSQVATDLPERSEQTILCELPTAQRKLYNEVREHYRATLLSRVDAEGLGQSQMHVLEALLRLRQTACHPALCDPQHEGLETAKVETLLEMVGEVLDEGHKALVFSQFTSMLAIVRAAFERRGVVYEYLDGKTRDRQERVDRFQQDPDCRLFLISLKAGGTGLNLTAAEYVFILDPWWNPAAEAQAIDRAHRIGQKRKVIAYRLIARDTVEERIVELQQSKRKLADALITADNSVLRTLTRDDLALLLT